MAAEPRCEARPTAVEQFDRALHGRNEAATLVEIRDLLRDLVAAVRDGRQPQPDEAPISPRLTLDQCGETVSRAELAQIIGMARVGLTLAPHATQEHAALTRMLAAVTEYVALQERRQRQDQTGG